MENEKEREKERTTAAQLAELKEDEAEALAQFVTIIYKTNPRRGSCKVWIDGNITFPIKYEKLEAALKKILFDKPVTADVYTNFKKILESFEDFDCYFYYNRLKNEFRELKQGEEDDFMKEHLQPEKPRSFVDEQFKKVLGLNKASNNLFKNLQTNFLSFGDRK